MTVDEIIAALAVIATTHPALTGDSMLDAAVHYAGTLGWPVFPLKVGEKTPATRNGLHDATNNLEQVLAWWETDPYQNIGLPTGHHFDVIDIDHPHGFAGFDELCATTGSSPTVLAAAHTANGGRHLLVAATGRGNFAGLRPGVDYRGLGGYIVAPPSRLQPKWSQYAWVVPPQFEATS